MKTLSLVFDLFLIMLGLVEEPNSWWFRIGLICIYLSGVLSAFLFIGLFVGIRKIIQKKRDS